MGRVRQTFITRVGNTLLEEHPDEFKADFEHNKRAVDKFIQAGEITCPSKRMRNRLAGYITRAVKVRTNKLKLKNET